MEQVECSKLHTDQKIIRERITLALFVKEPDKSGLANVYHADLFGLRKSKYECLGANFIKTTDWKKVRPQKKFYLFKPQDTMLVKEYEKGWEINKVMPINSVGLYTARDHFAIQWSRQSLEKVIDEFVRLKPEDASHQFNLGKDSKEWKVNLTSQIL